ncbi:hypothetical protein [Microvirga massiliensis]|uniref:hypothetical protein n=1 Tax=Microvirga massiliensis TaxID=1033741 RepID=UPI0011CBB09C|nr:hypothetical protein [Microvirga massiliensis]
MAEVYNLKVISEYNKFVSGLASAIFVYIQEFTTEYYVYLRIWGMLAAAICIGSSVLVMWPLSRMKGDSYEVESSGSASIQMKCLSAFLWIQTIAFIITIIVSGFLGISTIRFTTDV